MFAIFALMVAGGLAVNAASNAIIPPTVQVCVPYVTDAGLNGTVCRTERDNGQGREVQTARAE